MKDDTFRRIVWSTVLLVGVTVWAFAIIGARTVLANPPANSIWPVKLTAVQR